MIYNNWLNRATKQLIFNVSPSDMGMAAPESDATWIYDPDLSAVEGIPSKYWIITGDAITEMSQAQKDAVDEAALTASRDSAVDSEVENLEGILRQVIKLLINELNILRAEHGLADRTLAQLKTQIRNGLGS